MPMRLFLVTAQRQPDKTLDDPTYRVITLAMSREYAKSKSHSYLGGNPDNYEVTPITNPGDRIYLDVSLECK